MNDDTASTLVDLVSDAYLDKLAGCWLGKSAGGTLGQPLEEAYGAEEPFDVWWYPELPEGGIANDDLELHLVWLKALEEVGPRVRAADLARYWLAYTGYNWDEYGMCKANLRLGLAPPLSGSYSNWFKDCMGSTVRSEIWACVAPGRPALATRLAYEDTICDHAGGEGVMGELFTTAIQSAAFVRSDSSELIEIGLSYVKPDSVTRRAIEAAREAHRTSRTWQEARSAVIAAAPNMTGQYSPVNLGFVVVGWLFGDDFGDALCKTVNCGYDTDSTGATLGATLGIVHGAGALPQRWIEPIGDTIPTNESWGGVRNLSSGSNPAPTTLSELGERIAAVAQRIRIEHRQDHDEEGPTGLASETTAEMLWGRSPTTTIHDLGLLRVEVEHGPSPAFRPGECHDLSVSVENAQPDPVTIHASISREGWRAGTPVTATVDPGRVERMSFSVCAPSAPALENSQVLRLAIDPERYPALESIPIVAIGARRYLLSGPYALDAGGADGSIAAACPPEVVGASVIEADAREGDWREASSLDHSLPLDLVLGGPGVAYIRAFLEAPRAMAVRLGVSSDATCRYWVNGDLVLTTPPQRVRPSFEGHGQVYGDTELQPGWNEVLLKFVRSSDAPSIEGHMMLSDRDRLFAGIVDVGWTRFPWER